MKSLKPSKQRKAFYGMPLHRSKRRVSSSLSKELRKETGRRSLSLRKGDKVKVVRGSHKSFEGKIARVDRALSRVFIEKLLRKKADGTEILIPVNPSNVVVTGLERGDERRSKRIKKAEAGRGMKAAVEKREEAEESKKEEGKKKAAESGKDKAEKPGEKEKEAGKKKGKGKTAKKKKEKEASEKKQLKKAGKRE